MPDRVEGSIAPIVEYEMSSVPVALPEFMVPGLDTEIELMIPSRAGWWHCHACLQTMNSASSLALSWS